MNWTLLRRFGVLLTLMFWQGGFLFYAAVVVPVGTSVLGSDREQGLITRDVTNYLNSAGVAALAVWAWDLAAGRRRDRARWLIWAGAAASVLFLAWLHPRMDALLDPDDGRIADRVGFYRLHRWYLVVSTLQGAGALTFAFCTLRGWRKEDRRIRGE